MNQKLIDKGNNQYFNFIDKIGLKSPIKTPTTNALEDLGRYESESEEFKIIVINMLYHEFFYPYIKEDKKFTLSENSEVENDS